MTQPIAAQTPPLRGRRFFAAPGLGSPVGEGGMGVVADDQAIGPRRDRGRDDRIVFATMRNAGHTAIIFTSRAFSQPIV